ncbi:hypothetical protein JG29_15960 [Bombilactobacillus mellis]|uniref:FRG domain-containing protein n=1 Tax=Bombilactobacillus mellis TaxID=1218508 RepID=A0A0F4KS95_9LACO|nr:FRG domain-containing protein [Bombilactobacillus mellis]KJY48081.1 hypothetical protein JG29_15960 [Bombilactobacillus mellis]
MHEGEIIIKRVNSVDEYLNEVPNSISKFPSNREYLDGRYIKGKLIQNMVLYRGQNKNYGSTRYLASLFRQQKDEYSLTSTYMNMHDLSKLDNNFSRLSYMQHFGLPTRLLDFTVNKLVALYFACQPDKNGCFDKDDGIIDICFTNTKQNDDNYFSPNVYSYYDNSNDDYMDDIVELDATLALMTENDKSFIYNKIHEFEKFVRDSFSSIAKDKKDINFDIRKYYSLFCRSKRKCIEDNLTHPFEYYMSDVIEADVFIPSNTLTKIYNYYNYNDFKIDVDAYVDAYIEETNRKAVDIFTNVNNAYDKLYGSPEIQSLLIAINKEMRLKDPVIDFVALLHPFFVSPSINNPRIEAQEGAFLFEPYEESENFTKADINEDIKKRFSFEESSIIIPANRKESILKKLDDKYNINSDTLFPDSENIAKYISRGY